MSVPSWKQTKNWRLTKVLEPKKNPVDSKGPGALEQNFLLGSGDKNSTIVPEEARGLLSAFSASEASKATEVIWQFSHFKIPLYHNLVPF